MLYFDLLIMLLLWVPSEECSLCPLQTYEDAIFGPNGNDSNDFELPDEAEPFLLEKNPENEITVTVLPFAGLHW